MWFLVRTLWAAARHNHWSGNRSPVSFRKGLGVGWDCDEVTAKNMFNQGTERSQNDRTGCNSTDGSG